MNISLDYSATYLPYKEFFDEMAKAMQKTGHKVGIIAGDRERDPFSGEDLKEKLLANLGFKPDFCHMWGSTESIANGSIWKVEKMIQEQVLVHFDSDATQLKRYTDLWIFKVMDPGQKGKF